MDALLKEAGCSSLDFAAEILQQLLIFNQLFLEFFHQLR
jgi:hypothetical protein